MGKLAIEKRGILVKGSWIRDSRYHGSSNVPIVPGGCGLGQQHTVDHNSCGWVERLPVLPLNPLCFCALCSALAYLWLLWAMACAPPLGDLPLDHCRSCDNHTPTITWRLLSMHTDCVVVTIATKQPQKSAWPANVNWANYFWSLSLTSSSCWLEHSLGQVLLNSSWDKDAFFQILSDVHDNHEVRLRFYFFLNLLILLHAVNTFLCLFFFVCS